MCSMRRVNAEGLLVAIALDAALSGPAALGRSISRRGRPGTSRHPNLDVTVSPAAGLVLVGAFTPAETARVACIC